MCELKLFFYVIMSHNNILLYLTTTTKPGRFEVERSKLERVETVEECANKYREEKYILRWTLKKHKCRKLYLLCDSEEDLLSWINLFKDYKQVTNLFADHNKIHSIYLSLTKCLELNERLSKLLLDLAGLEMLNILIYLECGSFFFFFSNCFPCNSLMT